MSKRDRKIKRIQRKMEKDIGKALFGKWRWRKYLRERKKNKNPTASEVHEEYIKKYEGSIRSNFLFFLEKKNKEQRENG